MKRTLALVISVVLFAAGHADVVVWVTPEGIWPASWPAELEPLRKQSRSWNPPNGPDGQALRIHRIAFTDREQFESAWPHLLKIKTKGAPIILELPYKRKPAANRGGAKTKNQQTERSRKWKAAIDEFLEKVQVTIYCPVNKPDAPPAYPGQPHLEDEYLLERWRDAYVIILCVDGKIVDLNRIVLPADTPIDDERFKDGPPQPQAAP